MAELSPLRRRMIEDMTVRNLSPATQRSYLSAVSKLTRYFGRFPDHLGLKDVRAFQVHLVATRISWPALNQIVCALRFFYGVTLGHDGMPEHADRHRGFTPIHTQSALSARTCLPDRPTTRTPRRCDVANLRGPSGAPLDDLMRRTPTHAAE